MSKIIAIFEAPGLTLKTYDDMMAELKTSGDFPNENCLLHASFQKGDKLCAVDIWNSEAALIEYAQSKLVPLFNRRGITPPQPQIYPVYHFVDTNVDEFISA